MDGIIIRRFKEEDASEVSNLIKRNFLEVNIKDYPLDLMKKGADTFTTYRVKSMAYKGHVYVAVCGIEVVATGTIMSYFDKIDESIILTVFVKPEHQRQGIGRLIMESIENDEYFKRANRIEIPSSITGCEFYIKLGYSYKNGTKELDNEGHYRLEKIKI